MNPNDLYPNDLAVLARIVSRLCAKTASFREAAHADVSSADYVTASEIAERLEREPVGAGAL